MAAGWGDPTLDPAGAERMKQILEDLGLVPKIEIAKGANRIAAIL